MDASRVDTLSAASSFFVYLDTVSDTPVLNPFAAVRRPVLVTGPLADEGLSETEAVRLLPAARDLHQSAAYRPRAYALLLVLCTVCLPIDSVLAVDVEDLGHDRGRHELDTRIRGGTTKRKAIPSHTWQALQSYLDGRTAGPLFTTASGGRLDEPAVWRLLRSLACRAGLPQAEMIHPHALKTSAIPYVLDRPHARIERAQAWADHKDARTTGRYSRWPGQPDGAPGHGPAEALAHAPRLAAGRRAGGRRANEAG
ncbi:tyrosine-type recombinase/integrase [Streptomyces prasinus]|uniref:tyrosine-type recombinase/integrase n=1 Tax=Streptomyces prasinus TaxID=67345 RepID=UPI0033F1BA7E